MTNNKQIDEGQAITGGYTGKGAGLSGFVHPGVGPLYASPTGEELAEEQRSYDAHQAAGEAGYFDGTMGKFDLSRWFDQDYIPEGVLKKAVEDLTPGSELPLTIEGRRIGTAAILGRDEDGDTTASISFDVEMPEKYKVPSPAELLGEAAFSIWDMKPPVTTDHKVEFTLNAGGTVDGKVTCLAKEGAECRVWCDEGCDYVYDGHENHKLFDQGTCGQIPWFEDYVFDSYDGKTTPLRDGYVNLIWYGDGYTWNYANPINTTTEDTK